MSNLSEQESLRIAKIYQKEKLFFYANFLFFTIFLSSLAAFYLEALEIREYYFTNYYIGVTLFISFIYLGINAYILKSYLSNEKVLAKIINDFSYILSSIPALIIIFYLYFMITSVGVKRLGILYLIFLVMFYIVLLTYSISYIEYKNQVTSND